MTNVEMTLAEAQTRGFELVLHHTDRFLDHTRGFTSADLALPVPGLTWTVGEVIAHVQSVVERYTVNQDRGATPSDVHRMNGFDVDRLGVDLEGAVRSISEQVKLLSDVVDHVSPDMHFPFHSGQQITLAGGWGNWLGELLAHGDDLARGTGRPFDMPGSDLEILWRHTFPVMAGWLRWEAQHLSESWDLHFEFGTVRVVLDQGCVRVGPDEPMQPEHHDLDVTDASAFTLAFPYRRRPIRDPDVALLATRFQDV
jgi:uncharacterized protein (TIGR03083 family)